MIVEAHHNGAAVGCSRIGPLAFSAVLLTVCAVMLGGCGSTAPLVKKDSPVKSLAAHLREPARNPEPERKPASEQPAEPRPKKAASSKSTYSALPMDSNGPRVRGFVRHYAYEQRPTMRRYLTQAKKYLPMVRVIAKEEGLPEDIAYLFMLESGANPDARSPANAVGMWQFMPATARSYGLRVDSWVDERLDPERSTRAAMLYLKDLYGMFGCWRLALSAYNSGENKLNRVLCQEDASEYDQICSSRRLRKETREFWPRFQAIAHIAKNPDKFGFAPLDLAPYEKKHDVVNVEGTYSLATIANVAGTSLERLAEMNPALVRRITPPKGIVSIRVPLGKKLVVAQNLEKAPTENAKTQIVHVVNKGDSIGKILRRYRVGRAELAGVNPDVNFRRRLRSGEKIVIPVAPKPSVRRDRKPERVSLLER